MPGPSNPAPQRGRSGGLSPRRGHRCGAPMVGSPSWQGRGDESPRPPRRGDRSFLMSPGRSGLCCTGILLGVGQPPSPPARLSFPVITFRYSSGDGAPNAKRSLRLRAGHRGRAMRCCPPRPHGRGVGRSLAWVFGSTFMCAQRIAWLHGRMARGCVAHTEDNPHQAGFAVRCTEIPTAVRRHSDLGLMAVKSRARGAWGSRRCEMCVCVWRPWSRRVLGRAYAAHGWAHDARVRNAGTHLRGRGSYGGATALS